METHSLRFERSFAAAEGWVKAPERSYRDEVCLNGSWLFQPLATPRHSDGTPPPLPAPTPDGWSATPLKVPSPWNVNRWTVQGRGGDPSQPYRTDSVYYPSYPKAWDDVQMGWLRRSFRVPPGWAGRRLRIRFEAVAGECEVRVNGRRVGRNSDSFLPFEVDATDAVRPGADNELTVGVRDMRLWNHAGRAYEAFRAPYPPGSTLDHIVGIWQDVTLLGLPDVRVSDAFLRPRVGAGTLDADVTLQNDTDRPRTVTVGGDVSPWISLAGKSVLEAPEPKWKLGRRVLSMPARRVTVPPRSAATVTLSVPGDALKTWSPDAPNLYGLVLSVAEDGKTVDRKYTRFGWREFKIAGRDLLLNGKRIVLYGDLLHPFGPFVGSRRYVWSWYRMIKDMGGNAVRPHAQPHPAAYLDLADEMGLCVLDETALFGSSIQMDMESPEAWRRYEDHYDRLVRRDRNHPSVFGWSCGNELFALFFKVPELQRTAYYDRLKAYAKRSFRLDPTRDWVSCDGDEDLSGGAPVWSRHHGIGLPTLADTPKPRMVGESGGSYYAKPGQLAGLNGDRAYESYLGRNEALAIDLYRNVEAAKANGLAFFSASETAWFGLEHLPLGYTDRSRPPSLVDGVRFGPYQEGQPGVQPERLPPYCMTLNPGFDPSLPLYRPLPMFEAFKAALAESPLAWRKAEVAAIPLAEPRIGGVAFVGNPTGTLAQRLASYGVRLSAGASELMVIEADAVEKGSARALKERIGAVLGAGGTVLVALGFRADASALTSLLPKPVELTERTASMLVSSTDPATAGLALSDLYFAEDPTDAAIAKRGLDGPFVAEGKTLLRASDTEWTLFNDRSEEEKCSNLLIYERLVKPSGVVLSGTAVGRGRLLVSTIDYGSASRGRTMLWRRLFANLGVALGEPRSEWVLPIAMADEPPSVWRYTTTRPDGDWTNPGFADADWRQAAGGFGTDTPHSRVRTPWTTPDIWLRRSFTLGKDDIGDLRLWVYQDEDAEVYINGVLVHSAKGFVQDYQERPLSLEAAHAFREGANVIAVHCHQSAGGQYIDVGISRGPRAAGGREYDPLRDGPKVP